MEKNIMLNQKRTFAEPRIKTGAWELKLQFSEILLLLQIKERRQQNYVEYIKNVSALSQQQQICNFERYEKPLHLGD